MPIHVISVPPPDGYDHKGRLLATKHLFYLPDGFPLISRTLAQAVDEAGQMGEEDLSVACGTPPGVVERWRKKAKKLGRVLTEKERDKVWRVKRWGEIGEDEDF